MSVGAAAAIAAKAAVKTVEKRMLMLGVVKAESMKLVQLSPNSAASQSLFIITASTI
jgi:hypothetical protein